jgi:hypothetical protein
MTPLDLFLRGLTGMSRKTKDVHTARIRKIANLIEERWGIKNPHHWRAKHLRWALEVALRDLSPATRKDYYYSALKIAEIRGRCDDWEPLLHGPWAPRRKGPGGRPRIPVQRVDEPRSRTPSKSDDS